MRIYITGVSCVGKTTIGAKLAALLDCPFFDLDEEIENYFSMSIARLQKKCFNIHEFRSEAAKVLKHLLLSKESQNSVITLLPSGLMYRCWQIVKRSEGTIVCLSDDAKNILKRITFYDDDSKIINKELTEKEKTYYLKDLKKDISFFKPSYKRAHLEVNISGLDPDQAAINLKKLLNNMSI